MKVLFSVLVILTGMILVSFNHTESGGYQVGDTATDFSLKNIDDTFVSMADYPNANGYIVIFTCNTCPIAKMYEKRIIELHEKYAHMGYPVIAINPNDPQVMPGDSFAAMKERAKNKGYEFPYLFDAGQVVYPQYGATKTPHVFLLDSQLIVKYIGAIDDNMQNANGVKLKYLENAIGQMETGQDPNPSVTKAVGCSIKVKA